MKTQALKEALLPNLDIYSNATINLMQVEKVCYEIIINLYSYRTVYLIYFVPYFFVEDQASIPGHYSWWKQFEMSRASEKTKTHTWISNAKFWKFFQLYNWENGFCPLFRGVGWFVRLFSQEQGIFVGSRPCSSLQEQALGLLASDMLRNIKERYIFGAVSWYSPAYLFVINWKKLLNWKEGQTIYRRTKPVRARSVQISMKRSCFNSYLNGLLSSWTTFLWPATADSFSQGEITCDLLRAVKRCVF